MNPSFKAGENIAIKVPPHQFADTVNFYRNVIGLEELSTSSTGNYDTVVFRFGSNRLWVDRTSTISHAEIWLEIKTNDIETAAQYLESRGIAIRDGIEDLPANLKGIWVSSPSNIIHLICESR